MASACVNNIGLSPENRQVPTYPSFEWLSPRISFGRDSDRDLPAEDEVVVISDSSSDPSPLPDPEASAADFEFRLQDPVAMLPADQLFSDGKLVPLQLSSSRPSPRAASMSEEEEEEVLRQRRRAGAWDADVTDPCIFSPKAPRCSSRWKELLGLKKFYQQSGGGKSDSRKAAAWYLPSHGGGGVSSSASSGKPIRHFLHKHSKSTPPSSSSEASLMSLPLLPYSDCEFVSLSSRLSLSSSSSSSGGGGQGHQDFDDHPRLSLDSDKPNHNPQYKNPKQPNPNPNPNPARARVSKPRGGVSSAAPFPSDHGVKCTRIPRRAPTDPAARGGVSADSPRMNSCGKVVFHGLERSTSSPCSFNGGPRFKPRGMERSYSTNVRITPVLNVPVCSLIGSAKSAGVFGFGQLFGGGGGGGGSGSTRGQLIGNNNCRNRG